MTQSSEYPDLRWMPPASWTNANRGSVQLVVIHTTEGSEGPTSAEDGAAYDQRRTDGTSTHFFHDSDSTVQCVRTEDIAHAARHEGNLRGIQHELCGSAYQGSAGWADAVSQGTLRQAAKQVARDCKKWGIPVRKLTVAQVADGVKGICGHIDVTYAFPQDNGTHTDPGPTFPWSQFLDMVQAEMEGDMALDATDHAGIRNDAFLGGGYDVGQAFVRATTGDPADATATDRGIRNGWDAGMSFAIQSEYNAIMAGIGNVLTALTSKATADDVLAQINAARDAEIAAAKQRFDQAAAELAAARTEIAGVDEEVIAKLGDPGTPDEQVAAALVELLGDRKDAVLALMQ